jgi:hypothetical protein
VAAYSLPSLVTTEICCAPEITWLLVRIRPSALSTTPEPIPLPCAAVTFTCTTLGNADAAMALTSSVDEPVVEVFAMVELVTDAVTAVGTPAAPMSPPAVPATTAAANAAAVSLVEVRRQNPGALASSSNDPLMAGKSCRVSVMAPLSRREL